MQQLNYVFNQNNFLDFIFQVVFIEKRQLQKFIPPVQINRFLSCFIVRNQFLESIEQHKLHHLLSQLMNHNLKKFNFPFPGFCAFYFARFAGPNCLLAIQTCAVQSCHSYHKYMFALSTHITVACFYSTNDRLNRFFCLLHNLFFPYLFYARKPLQKYYSQLLKLYLYSIFCC